MGDCLSVWLRGVTDSRRSSVRDATFRREPDFLVHSGGGTITVRGFLMGLTYYPSPRAHAALNPDALRESFVAEAPSWDGHAISSPYDLHVVEAVRARHGLGKANGVPTDVFVWGQGEPKDRTVTKVGGLPCWGAETPWPERNGGPPNECAQIVSRFPRQQLMYAIGPGSCRAPQAPSRVSDGSGN